MHCKRCILKDACAEGLKNISRATFQNSGIISFASTTVSDSIGTIGGIWGSFGIISTALEKVFTSFKFPIDMRVVGKGSWIDHEGKF